MVRSPSVDGVRSALRTRSIERTVLPYLMVGVGVALVTAQHQDPTRPVLVVLGEVVPRHWWEAVLHNQTALRLKLRLFFRRNTIVADVPYHRDERSPR